MNLITLQTFTMQTRTRIKITLVAALLIIAFAILAVFKGMENLSITCIGALMTILTAYIWAETKRPSKKR